MEEEEEEGVLIRGRAKVEAVDRLWKLFHLVEGDPPIQGL